MLFVSERMFVGVVPLLEVYGASYVEFFSYSGFVYTGCLAGPLQRAVIFVPAVAFYCFGCGFGLEDFCVVCCYVVLDILGAAV